MKFSAAFIAATRKVRGCLPKCAVVTATQYEHWQKQCRRIRRACLRSYLVWGHCENPYPVGDLRRSIWAEATVRIGRHYLSQEHPEPGKQKVNWECEEVYI